MPNPTVRNWKEFVRSHLSNLRIQPAREQEIVSELAQHVEQVYSDAIARRLSEADAMKQVEARFSNWAELAREIEGSEPRPVPESRTQILAGGWDDFRNTFRLFLKERAFAASVVLTMGLGIGANTAVFSVVNAALLRPLPFPDASRIVAIENTDPKHGDTGLPIDAADYYDFRARNQTLQELGIVRFQEAYGLTVGAEPESVIGHSATASFLRALGVTPWAGRLFNPDEEISGKDQAMLLSYGFWARRFGSDPSMVGTRVVLGGIPRNIVGILPPDFEVPDRPADVWVPLAPAPTEIQARFQHRYRMYGLIKPGITLARAREDFTAVNRQLMQEHPSTNSFDVHMLPWMEQRTAASKAGLWIIMAAVGLLLLIACANVANLILARSTARQKEMAIRVALGAGRFRILRQVLTESITLSVTGGIVGVFAAYWSVKSLGSWLPATLPGRAAIRLDLTTLAFALAISVITGILFGLSPALHTVRAGATEVLRQRSSADDRGSLRLRALLVMTEVAVSVILLVGGGLLVHSFLRVLGTDSGIDARNVLSMRIALPRARYSNPQKVIHFYEDLLQRLQTTTGVVSVGIVNALPLSGMLGTGPMNIEGRTFAPSDVPTVDWRPTSTDYFQTMGIPLIAGRGLAEYDTADAMQVAVADDKIAARYWPHENPIGRRIKLGSPDSQAPWMTIVGIVRNVRHDGLEQESRGQVYRPFRQYPVHGLPYWNYVLVIRTRGAAQTLAGAARRAILAVDPDQTAFEVRTMEDVLSRSVAPRRFQTTLVGGFAALALILASLGLYAVIAYSVTLRVPEIGIRMALGASRADILRLIAGSTAKVAGVGIILGLGAAVLLSRAIESQLYGVRARDFVSFGSAFVITMVVVMLASLAPMRRAVAIDPATTLRGEQ